MKKPMPLGHIEGCPIPAIMKKRYVEVNYLHKMLLKRGIPRINWRDVEYYIRSIGFQLPTRAKRYGRHVYVMIY